jgi:phage terminase large subunit
LAGRPKRRARLEAEAAAKAAAEAADINVRLAPPSAPDLAAALEPPPPPPPEPQGAPNAREQAEIIERLAADPVLFVESMLGATPQRWQAEALLAIANNDRVAIRSGHGVGKTAFLSWLVLWWLLTRLPTKVVCTANTAHQLSDVLWSEIGKWHRKLPEGMRRLLEIKSDKIELTGVPDSFAVARTSRREQPEALQGFHSENLLFVIDEASGVPDIVFEVGQGALSTEGAKVVMCGNPTRAQGYFYDAFTKSAARWWTRRVSCHDADTVDKGFLADMAAQYGDGSNQYRVRVLGEFPAGDDDTLIPRHIITAARDRPVAKSETAPVVWGLDVARFGDDSSALAKRRGNALVEPVKVWRGKDLMETCGLVKVEYDAAGQHRPVEILVDVIGLGAGVVDRLRELGLPVRGVNVAELPALDGNRFQRLRDELWWKAREWFEARDCSIPDDESLIDELAGPLYSLTSSGKIQVEPKAHMKRRIGRSPDKADAFCLTFAGVAAVASGSGGYGFKWSQPLRRGVKGIV